MIVAALAGALVAMGLLRVAARPRITVAVRSTPVGQVVELVGGEAGLGDLAEVLAGQGHDDILRRRSGDGWVLASTLIVEPGAELHVGGNLRLVSEPGQIIGLEARGGRLDVRDATVSSWDRRTGRPDPDPDDGRSWVLARDRATMDVLDARMVELGYDWPERYGVVWRTAGTGGEVRGSSFTGNWHGAWTAGTAPMRIRDSVFARSHVHGLDPSGGSRGFVIEDNEFSGNGRNGLILAVECDQAVVKGNRAFGNKGHGIVIQQRSDDVLVEANEVHDNGLAGIDVSGSARARLAANVVYANWTGVTVHDGAADISLERNRLTANRVDGMRVSTGGAVRTMRANLVDQNYRAGAYLDGGTAQLGPGNRLIGNEVGLWIGGRARRASVTGNTIAGNVLDGVHLEQGAGPVELRSNAIRSNGKAAFPVERVEGQPLDGFSR